MNQDVAGKTRIQWIDVAKGICMISVIASHLDVIEIYNVVTAFQLTVFFILSGYTLKQSPIDRQYLNKKFKSLMVPYFLTCLCVMIMDIFNSLYLGMTSVSDITGIVSRDLIRSFLASGSIRSLGSVEVGSMIGAIWFLPALFFAIIFTQFLLNHVSSRINRFIIASILLIIAEITGEFIWLPFSIQSAMTAVPFLLIGYELRQTQGLLEKLNWKMCLAALALFLICCYLDSAKIRFVASALDDIVIALIAALSSSAVIIYCSRHLEKVRPLSWIGRNSLLFLCTHLFALNTMEYWFDLWRERLSIVNNEFSTFCFELIFSIISVGIINLIKRLSVDKSEVQETFSETDRDVSIDIEKGMLIILMLVGTFADFEPRFSMILFSFYAVAFVFLSGYFFSPDSCQNMKRSILHILLKLGVPYLVFSILYVCMHKLEISSIQAVLFGMSGTETILAGQIGIGYAGFLLMLLLVRLGYLFLHRYLPNEYWVSGVCLALSVLGFWLGQQGYWLPWSLDLALYTMIFYHLGYCFREHHLLEYFRDNYITYFLLSVIWAYMIYSGSMNLAERQYSSYGMVILGAISAAILLYQCSSYLVHTLPGFLQRFLQTLGQSTLCILMIHVLVGQYFNALVSIRFTEGYIYYMVASVGLQVIAGMLVSAAISFVRKRAVPAKEH